MRSGQAPKGAQSRVCKDCGWRYQRENELKIHRLVHSEPAYPCPKCLKEFWEAGSLRKHQKRPCRLAKVAEAVGVPEAQSTEKPLEK
jgi:Zinc finger, C2H2 type